MQSLAEQGLAFIERGVSQTADAAVDDFLATTRRMGFAGCACGGWVGVGKNRRNRFFFVDWPQDWLDFYNNGRWFEHDRLVLEARRRIAPYFWSELLTSELTEGERALFEAGFAYGWKEVFAVPIHGPGSLQGLVTMGTRDELVFTARDRAILEIMGRAVWERCRISTSFGAAEASNMQFSPREIECLLWAAVGKSDADIASLLGIKPATAHFHIEQAKKRLGVSSRVEAVALGVLHGVI
jgi:DNA-binding CsgD family transcriptional regulator